MAPFDANIQIALTPDRDAYLPGDPILLHARVEAVDNVAVRGDRVELIGRLRYRYRTREWDQLDDRYETETKTNTDELVLTDTILGPETVEAGRPVERWVRFTVPRDAPPSGTGAIIEVDWSARATIDVPRRRDAVAEAPLRVLVPQEVFAAQTESSFIHETETARLLLTPESRHVVAGQVLAGTLQVEARTDFTVRSIRLQLVRQETVSREMGNTAAETVVEQEITGETPFFSGQHPIFPFSITVPSEVMPSSETQMTRVGWILRAILDRPRRGDEQVAVEINLYNAPSSEASSPQPPG